jgi:exosortase
MSSKSLGVLVMAALVALAAGPLAWTYLQRLWDWPHYQFYPVLFAVVAFIVWQRWPGSSPGSSSDPKVLSASSEATPRSFALIWIGLATEAAALWINSPWLGYLALVLIVGGVLRWATGGAWRSLLPAWLLLFLALRPPLRLDETLIGWLQRKTAAESSLLLDLFQVDHVREGVLIEIPGRTLFVEEACSGVQSLFSLVTMATVVAVWNRRPLIWSLLLIVAAVVGAGGANIIRTVSIVVGLERFQTDLLAEPGHTTVGLAVFVLSLAWLASWDQLLGFLLAPIEPASSRGTSSNLWIRLWDRWLVPWSVPAASLAVNFSASPRDRKVWIAGTLAVCLGVGGVWLTATRSEGATNPDSAADDAGNLAIDRLKALDEQALPETMVGWKRVRYERVERQIRSMFGDVSHTWTCEGPNGRVVLSVDFPFRGWHDLRECYEATGWQVKSTEAFGSNDESRERVRVELGKSSTLESAYLVFGACNDSLDFVPAQIRKPSTNDLLGRLTFAVDEAGSSAVTIQFQAFAVANAEWDDEGRASVERLFEQFRDEIRARTGAVKEVQR